MKFFISLICILSFFNSSYLFAFDYILYNGGQRSPTSKYNYFRCSGSTGNDYASCTGNYKDMDALCANLYNANDEVPTTNSIQNYCVGSGGTLIARINYLSCPEGQNYNELNAICEEPSQCSPDVSVNESTFIALNGVMCSSVLGICEVPFASQLSTDDGYTFTAPDGYESQPIGKCPFTVDEFRNAKAGSLACTLPFILDVVNEQCICSDGLQTQCEQVDDPDICNDNNSCLQTAADQCIGSQSLMNFTYLGGSNFNSNCGYQDSSCDINQSWNIVNQVCLADSDGDGTEDEYDPEPLNASQNGDADDDGVPDSQDQFPNDPERFDDFSGSGLDNRSIVIGGLVNPVGESTLFNDSAIVGAINETTKAVNSTNQLINSLSQVGIASNNIAETQNNILTTGFNNVNSGLNAVNNSVNSVDTSLNEIKESLNGQSQMPAFSSSNTVAQTNINVYTTIQNTPLVRSFDAVKNSIVFSDDNSCPNFSFFLPSPINKQISTNIHCELMPTLSVIISPVMFAIYLFGAFRVFVSA
jgi:hypothetical protein